MKNILSNWKTSSAGLLMILTSVIHLAFAIKRGTADETAWIAGLGAILGGIGLIAAGDASKSQKDTKDVDTKIDQTAKAVMLGDTTILPKPTDSPAPKAP